MLSNLVDGDSSVSSVTGKEVEVFPGVIERRFFLHSSLATAAAILALGATTRNLTAQERMPAPKMVATEKATTGSLTWDAFLKQAVPVAQQLVAEPAFSLDEYLYRLGSLATRLQEIPDTKLFPFTGVDARVQFAPSFRGSPFVIIQWRMEPGALFPAHNHPNASVCTLGFDGEVRLRNFEVIGEAPEYASTKTFHIRETHNETIARGRINTLSPSRDNIHYFQVGKEVARGIDITTLHGQNAGFSFLEISEKPADSEKRIFEASWKDLLRQPAMKS